MKEYVMPVKRRPARPVVARKVHTVHDASKQVGMPALKSYGPPALRTNEQPGYTGRSTTPSMRVGQGFVYEHASVFGAGNPRTIGATGGQRHIVRRTNVSAIRNLAG